MKYVFQRIQLKSYIIFAHSADFLQKYLFSADPSTRVAPKE